MVKSNFKQIDLLRERRNSDYFLVEPSFIDKKKYINKYNETLLWAHRDLNPEPADYESVALTNWAMGPKFQLKFQFMRKLNKDLLSK